MKFICSVWHIPIQMLIACRQQMRWHSVIIITDKLEIFIFCRQRLAVLTFPLFSWDCPVYDQYGSCPAEDWPMCSGCFFFFSPPLHSRLVLSVTVRLSHTARLGVCQKAPGFWNSCVIASHLMNFHFLFHCYMRAEPGLRLFLFLSSSTAWCSCMKIPKYRNCGQRSRGEPRWHSLCPHCEQWSTVKLHHSMISVGFLLKLTLFWYLIWAFTHAFTFSCFVFLCFPLVKLKTATPMIPCYFTTSANYDFCLDSFKAETPGGINDILCVEVSPV